MNVNDSRHKAEELLAHDTRRLVSHRAAERELEDWLLVLLTSGRTS